MPAKNTKQAKPMKVTSSDAAASRNKSLAPRKPAPTKVTSSDSAASRKPYTKVSQATIDKIKTMGMTKALQSASSGSAEFREGVKRMYGEKRIASVKQNAYGPNNTPKYRPATAKRTTKKK